MREQVLINITPRETRVAMVEDGLLQEIFIERTGNKSMVGNIYLGIVVRVLSGMQAAFINIGMERSAFLHANDLVPRGHRRHQLQQCDPHTNISSMLAEGQRILVQVVKDPLGGKGARLTAQISIAARNVVFLPDADYVCVSQRITGPAVREKLRSRLKQQVSKIRASGGFIVRTAGENATADQLESDITFLCRVRESISRKQKEVKAPALVHQNLPLAMRTIRDLAWHNIEKVRIDSREIYHQLKDFARHWIPDALNRIEHYPGDRPIFELYGVEEELQRALDKKVPLRSGGHLTIDQTEAMTTIDVNTGSFVGNRSLEQTIFTTNLEAAAALARQLRVRNLGGIIIIDFIDMARQEHIDQVMAALHGELQRDSNQAQANNMTALGLVEITRKRTSESLEQLLTEPCPACHGRGIRKTPQTICYEIFREVLRTAGQFDARQYPAKQCLITASQDVVDLLRTEESAGVADLALLIKKEIRLQVEPDYHRAQYEVILM